MKKHALKQKKRFNFTVGLVAAAGIAVAGYALLVSIAASPVAYAEAEAGGTPTAGANTITDATASSNKALLFGAAATIPDPDPGTGGGYSTDSECQQTAAAKYNWGTPKYQSDFSGTTLDPTWHPYGPEPGHNNNGERTPEQIKVADGKVSLIGAEGGKTAAMKWFPGQKYGRWEGCLKVDPGQGFNSLFLHWSDDETFGTGGGEIDWVEISGDDHGSPNYFLHCGDGGPNCDNASVDHDSEQWTAWAMEWTPDAIVTYVNGEEWHRSTNPSQFPPRPMNWCIQLDWFGNAGTGGMTIDWTKQYTVDESVPSTLGLKPGEPATGQPGDYPDRVPRPMSVEDMLP